MTIKTKTTEGGEVTMNLEDFRSFYGDDLDKIVHYEFKDTEPDKLCIAFYDKNMELVLPKAQNPVK